MKIVTLGKIEDFSRSEDAKVPHGRVDQHWRNLFPNAVDAMHRMFDVDRSQFKWLFNEDKVANQFDLKYIEFGNWMTQDDRALFLAASAMTFENLARVLKVSKQEIGLKQTVALALGARGTGGKAAAHYELSPYTIINLTKTKGQKSLVHEYGHAIDNLIANFTKLQKNKMASGGRTTRKTPLDPLQLHQLSHGERLFEDFFTSLYSTGFKDRLARVNSDYYECRAEVWARTFETWVARQFDAKDINNKWGVKSLGFLNSKSAIYPNAHEIEKVDKYIRKIILFAFDLASGKEKSNLGAASILRDNSGLDFNGSTPKYQELKDYSDLISKSTGRVESKEGELKDTISIILKLSREGRAQVTELAKHLYTGDFAQDCFNIWHFLKVNIKYGFDQGGEEIRTPAASWANRHKRIDCEDFAIFAAALLQNMGYPATLEIVGFDPSKGMPGRWHHIYVTSRNIVIDPVMDSYNLRPDGIIRTMNIDILSGKSHSTDDVMYGLGAIEPQLKDATTINLENRVKPLIERWNKGDRSDALRGEIRKFRFLIRLNGTEERDILFPMMQFIVDVHPDKGIIWDPKLPLEAHEQIADYILEARNIDDLSGLGALNLRNLANRVTTAVKNTTKKVQTAAQNVNSKLPPPIQKVTAVTKKAVKAAVVYSPPVIAARAAFLTLLKLRIFGMARKLWYGYQTPEFAKAQGWNLVEHAAAVKRTKEAEDKFVKKFGGQASKFKEAVLKGGARAIKHGKIEIKGLGMEPATATVIVASIGAATPILLSLTKLIGQNNPAKITNGQEVESLVLNPDGSYTYEGAKLKLSEDGQNLIAEDGSVIMTKKEADALMLAQGIDAAGEFIEAMRENMNKPAPEVRDNYSDDFIRNIDDDSDDETKKAGLGTGGTIAISLLVLGGVGTALYMAPGKGKSK